MPIFSAHCTSHKEEILRGVHQPDDTYKIALFSSAASLDEKTEKYSPKNEVKGKGYEAGGMTLEGFSTGRTERIAWLSFKNTGWPDSTITARGALIYNASKQNRAVCVLDFGEEIRNTNSFFPIIMPPDNDRHALLRLL